MLITRSLYQRGMSIIELLIGMTVGLIVVGMVLSVYLTTLDTSGDTLKAARLNQEMSAIMNIMVNDIRRAGYANIDGADWDGGGADDYPNLLEPSTNPFNQVDTATNSNTTALRAHQYTAGAWVDKTDPAAAGVSQCVDLGTGDAVCGCIVYGYDFDNDNTGTINGVIDNDEFYGFRYDSATNSIFMRYAHDYDGGDAPNSCTSGSWQRMNDESSFEITSLTFDLSGSTCVNSAEPDGNGADTIAEANCYNTAYIPAAGSGVRTVERRDVLITLEGRLKDDTNVKARMMQQVSVRNDLVREH